MIESLSGRVSGRSGTALLLKSGPIEWSIEMSAGAAISYSSREGEVQVPVHLIHREDAMTLYGFKDKSERSLFRELIKVSGIGPKQAVRILSGMESSRFIEALEQEDVDTISTIPGIGKKSAGKIILALRGKLTPAESDEKTNSGGNSPVFAEILDALTDMGFDKKIAEKALRAVLRELKIDNVAELSDQQEREIFRLAIVRLST